MVHLSIKRNDLISCQEQEHSEVSLNKLVFSAPRNYVKIFKLNPNKISARSNRN